MIIKINRVQYLYVSMKIKYMDSMAEVDQEGSYLKTLFIGGVEILKPSADGKETHGGSAVLIPFANRVRNHVFTFEGKQYTLPADSGNHSIHGLVRHVKWDILEKEEDSISLGYTITSPDFPSRLHSVVRYRLDNESFTTRFEIENTGKGNAPLMVGTHPYFLTYGDWDITADDPVKKLEYADKYFPTGQMTDFATHELSSGSGKVFDNCFFGGGNLHLHNGKVHIMMERKNMPYFQVYNGEYAEGKSVAIEPMTGAPDSFNNGMGLIVLEPGDSFTCSYTVTVIE